VIYAAYDTEDNEVADSAYTYYFELISRLISKIEEVSDKLSAKGFIVARALVIFLYALPTDEEIMNLKTLFV